MAKRECGSCEFWEAGQCKRFPPVMTLWPTDNQHPIMYMPTPGWPTVGPTDWCGEYAAAHQLTRHRP